jgi:predicted ATP-grasp superfamily ATP-dependent carboligase/glycosyltransferase involved in cell wall biosynthesis
MMEKKGGVSVILPSFNEAEALPKLIGELLGVFERDIPHTEIQIIAVDDNSPDGTASVVRDKFQGNPKVILIERKEEKGLASAVLRGIQEAQNEHVLVMDCDFNHPPEKVVDLVKNINSYDIVCYSRYVKGGGMNTDNKLMRYWGSRLYNKFLQFYLDLETNDNLSGFFIVRRGDVLKLPTDIVFKGYGEFYYGILYFMKKALGKSKILQLPIVYEKRVGGESKTKFASMMLQYFKKARLFKKYKLRKKKVLVTYARNRIAYVSAKSLSRSGYIVHAGDSVRFAMTFFSRYVKQKFIYPSPFISENDFIEKLVKYVKKKKIDILLPSHEEGFIISKYQDRFKNVVKMLLPSYEMVELASNKKKAYEYVEKLNIAYPKTFSFETLSNFDNFLKGEINFPVVVKLTKSRGSIGLEYADNKKELKEKFFKIIKDFKIKEEYPIIQEYIDGYGLGVSMLYKNGKMLAGFTHKRLIEMPVTGGTSVDRISFFHKKAEECAKKILDSLNWNGVAMLEFRVDKKTNEPYFLEINPRFWGSLNQAVISGVNFPLLICKALEEENFKSPEYKKGIRTRWFWGSIFVLPSYILCGKFREAFSILNIFQTNLHFDEASISDPLPFIINPIIPMLNFFTRGKITFETKEEEVINFNK